jgi:hypothetical protein
LLALIVVIVAVTYRAGSSLGMRDRISTRHAFYSIPTAISRLQFGTHGYVMLGDVSEFFIAANPNVTNETIQQSLALEPRRDRLMLFPADDKGGADFVTLSFRVFGYDLRRLYDAWFVLYVLPIAMFIAVFWRQTARLAALCVLLLGIYTAMFALPLTTELFSVHNPRAFGIVSLVSVLHLALAMIDRQRPTPARVAAAAVQAAIIMFSIHVRSTEVAQVIAVMGVAAVVYVKSGLGRQGLIPLWPAAVLIAAVAGLELYQRAAFDRVYADTHIQHRIFWHNVGIGFALNPALAAKYQLSIDDMPMIQLVRRRLVETGRAAELDDVFRPAGQEQYAYYGIAKDYVRYERIAREIVLSIFRNDTGQAVKTFVIDKPRVLFRQLAWAAGYGGYSYDDLYITGQAQALADEKTRAAQGIYLNPFKPWVLAALLAAVLLGAGTTADYLALAGLAAVISAATALPAMAAYPIISAIAVTLAGVPFLVLSVVAVAVNALRLRIAAPPS